MPVNAPIDAPRYDARDGPPQASRVDLPIMAWVSRHFVALLTAMFAGGFLLLIASAATGQGGDVIVGDAVFYAEYARSLMTTGQLPAEAIKYPCGVALIGLLGYGPVMGVAHLARILGASLSPAWQSGWSLAAQIAYCLPLLALSWIGFIANASMFTRLGLRAAVVKPMILFWIITTNVGFYVLKEPAMSEAPTYATVSLFYWALIRWFYETPAERERSPEAIPAGRHLARAAAVGAFLGLAGMIRQQNILHCLAVPLLLLNPSGRRLAGNAGASWRLRIGAVGVAAAASAALFVLPFIVWYLSQHTLVLYSYGGEHFNFLSPHLLDALFHPGYHGLFFWHPAYAVAAAGLFVFLRDRPGLSLAWLSAIIVQSYLIASWSFLSFGASVGHRGWFTVAPLLLGGWITAGDWMARRRGERPVMATVAVLAIANATVSLLVLTQRISPLGIPPR